MKLSTSPRLNRWREELLEEESRARLWVNERTVHVVSAYFLVMMQCSGWEEFGKGRLTEDAEFLGRLRFIFGDKVNSVLNEIVKRKSKTGEPWLVDCVRLSDRCLSVIQRRVYREVASPFFYESPQMRVGSGGASSMPPHMPPQQRNSIEINAPGEWKP